MNRSYRSIGTLGEFKDFIKDKSVSVVGIAVSNISLLRFLKKCGVEKITARDKRNIFEDGGAEELQDIKKIPGIKFILGENYLDDLNEDVIFKTPGIRRDLEPFLRAERDGRILTSEIELFLFLCPAKVIAITGSAGKSSTTTITGMILKYAEDQIGGKVYVGGNLGKPLLGEVEHMTRRDFAVLELSSFQLFDLDNGRFSPDYSVIMNITPNHLDWHKDMREYESAKKIIYKYQDKTKRTVLSYDCEATRILKGKTGAEEFFFSNSEDKLPESFENGIYIEGGEIVVRTAAASGGGAKKIKKIIDRSDIVIRGEHNVENFMAAIGVTHDIAGADLSGSIKKAAENFKGVEHRIEFVREVDGVAYYNSSIDSSPTRTITALNHFDGAGENNEGAGGAEKNIVVILGGYDKKIAFDPLVPVVSKKAKAAVLYGAAKEKIRKTFENNSNGLSGELQLILADNFDAAVEQASGLAASGDIVLLSPACASFDCFKNFEARGNRFKEIVNGIQ